VTHIEVFADIMCPFTHVSLRRLVDAREARHARASFRVRAWPLEWINGHSIERDLIAREIDALRSSVAPGLFAGFEAAPYPRSSIPAFGLVAAAYLLGGRAGEEVSLAVRDAVFERGLDVADEDVLRAIGRPWGIAPLDHRTADSVVRVDWCRGVARGVKGSPHFFVGDHDWFCPSLDIRHAGDGFDVEMDPDTLNEFYATALGH
jgi:predicted DsbA family dithiol-disulfide isomerase